MICTHTERERDSSSLYSLNTDIIMPKSGCLSEHRQKLLVYLPRAVVQKAVVDPVLSDCCGSFLQSDDSHGPMTTVQSVVSYYYCCCYYIEHPE